MRGGPKVWHRLKEMLLALIWPERVYCLCCGRLTGGERLCPGCREELDGLRVPWAQGKSMGTVWAYQGAAQKLVHRLKYRGVRAAAVPLAQGMSEVAGEMSLPPDTLVTWVTMPDARRRSRGIDHGRCLAETVARTLGLPVRQVLTRSNTIGRVPQQKLNRAQRINNLKDAFSCEEELHTPILLVDDVYTTGATAEVCRESLLRAGAPRVLVLTATKTLLTSNHSEEE